nr:discoidin domain-containing protein [uncultured Roseateles sp.]
MPIVITSDLVLSASLAQPLTHARIGHATYTRTGTATASTEADGFDAANAANPLTYEFWRPTALPAWWRLDAGAAVDCDYIGVAAHTLGSSGCTVYAEYSLDGTTWETLADVLPADDAPIMFLFAQTTARYWRVRVTGSTLPSVGVVYVGKALAMYRPIYGGHTPITLSRESEMRPTKSEGGQWLGRTVIRKGSKTKVAYQHLPAAWVREQFLPFIRDAVSYPYFFAWRPQTYPLEVGYVWTNDDIAPGNMGVRDLMAVDWNMEGLAVE